MPSAPASRNALALFNASSIPCSKIRLSIRAIIIKSSVSCTFLPAAILALKFSIVSCVCATSVPNREFFFKPVLSSIIMAETPIRSSVRTRYTKCSVSPPVSPSKIIGFVVTSMTSSIVLHLEVMSTSSISGFPFAVESQRELIHIASNWSNSPSFSTTVFSAIRPVKPLCTSIVFTIGRILMSCLKRFLLNSGIASFSFKRSSTRFTFSL